MGMWLIAGVGFLAVAFSFIVTFFHLRSCRSVVLPFIRVSNCRYGSICGHSDPYQHGYGQEKSERTVIFTVLPTEQFEDK